MAFIEINHLNKKDDSSHMQTVKEPTQFVICKSPGKLKLLLEAITPGMTVHYVSKGDWSMHDLVMQLVKTLGPSEIFFTTYALRETPIRQLVMGLQNGSITAIKMLVDTRAKIRTPEVFEMAKMNFCQIGQLNIHAKVCVIKSTKGSVCITGSANWTANPKIEAGVVSMNNELAEFHISWINKLINDADIFK
jgi:hypothetical protein